MTKCKKSNKNSLFQVSCLQPAAAPHEVGWCRTHLLFERYRFSQQGVIYLQDFLGPHFANITRRSKLYALWAYAAVCEYVTLCFKKCIVLSVVPVLFMFHWGRVGNVISIPFYILTCEEIDNKATWNFYCASDCIALRFFLRQVNFYTV